MTNSRTSATPPPADEPTPSPAAAGLWPPEARRARLHFVTGKGGTGKSTVSAALALALATGGKRVLLVETEERQSIAQLFDLPPLPYEERRIALAPGGGEVRALAIDVEAALLEYFALFYNLGFAARSLKKMGAVEFATTLAPGLRDVLITGKIKETVGRRERGRARTGSDAPVYDAVVVDAPPTGRVVTFLNVTVAMADLARRGPIHNQAAGVIELLHSPDAIVHAVTLLEAMPVTETVEAARDLAAADLAMGSIIVNRVSPAHLPDPMLADAIGGRIDTASLKRGLTRFGVTADATMTAGFAEEIVRHAERTAAEADCRAELVATGLPLIDLPALPSGVTLGELYELAEHLTDQGVAI